MRAVVYSGIGGVDVIKVRDLPDPEPGSDDALVAVAYAGLNRADILEREGRYGAGRPSEVQPGLEFSGVVRAFGSRVTSLNVGARVCGLVSSAAHAELVVTNAAALSPVPDGVSLETAAAIPEAFITAHDALFTRGRLALGQNVLVHAAGSGVGLAAIALAKRAGALVVGTSRTLEKLENAKVYGLDAGILLDDRWTDGVRDATHGHGVDVVLDFVGGPMLEGNLAVLAMCGRIVQIGSLGGSRATFPLGPLMAKRASLIGTMLRSRPLDEKIALARTFTQEVLPLFARGELRTEIDSVFPLDAIADAHKRMESDANFGKILIQVAGG